MDKICIPGLTPVTNVKNGKKYEVSVWNRTYTINESPFFSSILSGGKEVLASPIRVVGSQNGKEINWTEFVNLDMVDWNGKSQMFCQSAQSGELLLNTTMEIFYDGAVKCNLQITPTGIRKEVPKYTDYDITLDKLWLEIPLKKEFAKMYHVYPQYEPILLDGEVSATYWVNQALKSLDFIPKKSIETGFKHSIYLGNDHTGLNTFFESSEGWTPKDENRVMEVLVKEDEVVLRVHFLDSEHEYWRKKCEWKGFYVYPISFSFGLQATPVKPFPKNPFTETAYHDNGAIHLPTGEVKETLFEPIKNGNVTECVNITDNKEEAELLIDRLYRAGVKTVYIHEAWNSMQNSVFLTSDSAERLRRAVKACHERGMKLIPYFGFELSALSPIANRLKEFQVIGTDENYCDSQWIRRPLQKAYRICYASKLSRIWLDGIKKLMDEFKFDGLYLDGTFSPRACKNENHGCGWRDKEGKIHPTYSVWALREMLEELFEIVHERGGTINAHTGNSFSSHLITFADSLWDGEPIQGYFRRGEATEVPEGHIRSMYSGRNLGVPTYMICTINPPVWTFHNAITCVMPFGLLPKPQNKDGLDEMEKVWKVYKTIPFERAEFNAYYENDVKTTNQNVKVSCFDYDEGRFAIVVNMKKENSGKVEVLFDSNYKKAIDKLSGKELNLIDGNKLIVEYNDFDYSLIELIK